MKKIYIIGAGAIGKALALFLSQGDREVVVIRGRSLDVPAYQEEVNLLIDGEREVTHKVNFTSFNNLNTIDGLVIVATKSFANQAIAQQLKSKQGTFPIIVMQNGLGVESEFEKAGFPDIYRCVLFTTSHMDAEGGISFKTVAPSPIGIIKQSDADLNEAVKLLDTPEFRFRNEPNIQEVIWEKAIINCAYNSICPLLEVDNGIFYRDEKVLELADRIIKECVAVANAYKIELTETKVRDRLLFISEKAQGQFITTLQDIRYKRQTEIDDLNLAVARYADEINQPELVTLTRSLGQMIAIKSGMNR